MLKCIATMKEKEKKQKRNESLSENGRVIISLNFNASNFEIKGPYVYEAFKVFFKVRVCRDEVI